MSGREGVWVVRWNGEWLMDGQACGTEKYRINQTTLSRRAHARMTCRLVRLAAAAGTAGDADAPAAAAAAAAAHRVTRKPSPRAQPARAAVLEKR